MRNYDLQYYVLNENFNRNQCIEPYNIFNNYRVREETCNALDDYYAGRISFKEFKTRLENAVKYEEWSRCEYEIVVSPWPGFADESHDQKIDCYEQFMMNSDMVARYIVLKNLPLSRKKEMCLDGLMC